MAATNPLVSQGTLNRALSSVAVVGIPALNVTSGFFSNKVGRLSFGGETSAYIANLAGATPSPHLYQIATLTFYLELSQPLSQAWEQQRLQNPVIGDVIAVMPSVTLLPYYLNNCVLQNIADIDMMGDSNDFPITVVGTYPISAALFT